VNYIIAKVAAQRSHYIDMQEGNPEDISAVKARMLTVEEYNKLARRIIGKWAPQNAKANMLASEDAIDYVAHLIMVGDWGYDSTKSDIATYRGYRGKRAIHRYLKRVVNHRCFNNSEDTFNIIADEKAVQPSDCMEAVERQEETRRELGVLMGNLNETQRACVVLHHIENKTVIEIGHILGLTREAVRRSLKDAMKSMGRLVGVHH
jgi:RNA polymerase sigma factor (sigma-70 family)